MMLTPLTVMDRWIHSSNDADMPWQHDGKGNNSIATPQAHLHATEASFVVSIGFVICMVICIPFGYLNLVLVKRFGPCSDCLQDDNMWFQWFSLVGKLHS